MIHLLTSPATPKELREMLDQHSSMVKVAVDIDRWVLAGGGEQHADCENVLLSDGSEQKDIWGANWYANTGIIEYDSVINLRPRQKNYSLVIQDPDIRERMEAIIKDLLEGVYE
jgi:hypothetical protein